MMSLPGPIVILGNGGHAKVVLDVLRLLDCVVAGWAGRDLEPVWRGLPRLGTDDDSWSEDPTKYAIAVGIGDRVARRQVQERFEERGFYCPAIYHPAAYIATDCVAATGVQVMAGAVIQPDCRLGRGVLVNTGARVDHDCQLGAYSHIAPGAVLCGGVVLGDGVLVGAGATILPGVTVGYGAIIAAGAIVLTDVDDEVTVAGVPARACHA